MLPQSRVTPNVPPEPLYPKCFPKCYATPLLPKCHPRGALPQMLPRTVLQMLSQAKPRRGNAARTVAAHFWSCMLAGDAGRGAAKTRHDSPN